MFRRLIEIGTCVQGDRVALDARMNLPIAAGPRAVTVVAPIGNVCPPGTMG
ncbi:MAG: hypothetical protein Kow0063_17410 [Anaerolineae bacterium]